MPPGYNFTDNVRRALQGAREEAVRLHFAFVDTEHILLGLLTVPGCTAVQVLASLGSSPTDLRGPIEAEVSVRSAGREVGPDLPYTSRAKKVLELAMTAARNLQDTSVGTVHILLGLVNEELGGAARLLKFAGITAERVIAALRELGPHSPTPQSPESQRPARFTITVEFADGTRRSQDLPHVRDAIVYLSRWIPLS